MAAVDSNRLANCITCHAWNSDHSMIAICPNNNEVHIFKGSPTDRAAWERVHVLQKHDQLVSGVDWGPITNQIVTVSHDRNSYVWNLEGSEWIPTLVILRLNRAAISVKWSPKENKFAVGSGAKTVCICYYEQDNNWWVSKVIRKKHNSTVTGVAWHPNNVLLATTSTDGKCRVFSAFIKGIDAREDATTTFGTVKFGEQLVQFDLAVSWTFGVRWSPSGKRLAYAGHDSRIYFVDDMGPKASAQAINLPGLPLRDILFLSEKEAIAGGFDCNPLLFVAEEKGKWKFSKYLDKQKSVSKDVKSTTQFSEAFGKFYGHAKHGTSIDADNSKPFGVSHENCITCITPLFCKGRYPVRMFSTSGLDGIVVVWDVDLISEAFRGLGF